MSENQRIAAREFADAWRERGDEKSDTQAFWLTLLHDVYGVQQPASFIEFEKRVKLKNVGFIDASIEKTHVLIEQKSADVDLSRPIRQSDGSELTPFQQAERYNARLPYKMRAKWIVVCNFREFHVHDMDAPDAPPTVVRLEKLETEYCVLNFMTDETQTEAYRETQLSISAGELVGRLYDALREQYLHPDDPETLRSLNVLCARLVFCFYAEDAGILGKHNCVHAYLNKRRNQDVRRALLDLFTIFDTKPEDRDPYLDEDLLAFPYVNGGLFAEQKIEIPRFTPALTDLILCDCSRDFDWSGISPAIFGAVFESTLNPETRRSGGMHYTSIENIHRVIDPLFLDDLKAELVRIFAIPVEKTREKELREFQNRLGSMTFFDPACGSGNFLTETYVSLRRLENDVLRALTKGQMFFSEASPVKVSIGQFYGVEINDFAVAVARTALWIAENQMLQETEDVIRKPLDFLPLKSYSNIYEGNALRTDWEKVVPKEKLDFIMGNPPFVGYSLQSAEQKQDILSIYVDEKGKPFKTAGKIDYVAGWYFKAAAMMLDSNIRAAFVSTNSITQGEQVASVWKPLRERFNIHIDFARRTFRWDSEASDKARVHCVIVGFSSAPNPKPKPLYFAEQLQLVENINFYLVEASNVFIESRNTPICDVPPMTTGNRPADGGHLIIEADEYDDFIAKEPGALPFIKKLVGAAEFINNKKRWCLWLVGASPAELKKLPKVMERVEACKKDRENAPDPGRNKLAERPTLFRETNNPASYVIVPSVSSEKRKYVPIGFLDENTIPTNLVLIIPDASLFHFGVLTSSVHMAWMRAVCGRLEMRYRYSKDIVYNNFPWPTPTDEQKAQIERTARGILDARALYPDSSLADLYDELLMPPELRKAHQENDRAVMAAYGFSKRLLEPRLVAELMSLYSRLLSAE